MCTLTEPNGIDDVDRAEFYRRINKLLDNKRAPNFFLYSKEKYYHLLEQVKRAYNKDVKKTPADYRRLRRFRIIKTENGERLFAPSRPGHFQRAMFVYLDEIYDIIRHHHLELNHGGRTRMMTSLKPLYKNITAESVLTYLSLCTICKIKRAKRNINIGNDDLKIETENEISDNVNVTESASEILDTITVVSDPLSLASDSTVKILEVNSCDKKYHPELYSRGQIDILDVARRTKEEYKYLLVYRDLTNRYSHLKPLKTTVIEETVEVLIDLFLQFGAPNLLESRNGISVVKPICRLISTLSREIKVLPSETIDACKNEKTNDEILKMINRWLAVNKNVKWQQSLKYVQYELNTTFREDICRTPCELMYGRNPKKGLASFLSRQEYDDMTTENDLKAFLYDKAVIEDNQIVLEGSLIHPDNFIKLEN